MPNHRNILILLLAAIVLSGCNSGNTPRHYSSTNHTSIRPSAPQPEPSRHLQILDAIKQSRLRRRAILNKSEDKIFWALWRLLKNAGLSQELRILPQVNLGSAMTDENRGATNAAYNSIKCKRADFCLVNNQWMPIAFVEFQGIAHHGKTFVDNLDTLERDEAKQYACAQAGILYHAIPAKALDNIDRYLQDVFLPFLMERR